MDATTLIPRESLTKQVEGIFKPSKYKSFYHTIVGKHGTGKTTLVKRVANQVGKGVIYVAIPNQLEYFGDEFAKAIGWPLEEEHITVLRTLARKFLGTIKSNKSKNPELDRAMKAFRRGAAGYKARHGKPPVLILDNINTLGKVNPGTLLFLQDEAKSNADMSNYITVFVSSEGTVSRMMMVLSSWSRADPPMVIGDVTEDEALKYLYAKFGIDEKREAIKGFTEKTDEFIKIEKEVNQLETTAKLYELVGGCILDLKKYSDIIIPGEPFENIRQNALKTAKKAFRDAKMLESLPNHTIGKCIIQELLKNGEIRDIDYLKLVNNEELADTLL